MERLVLLNNSKKKKLLNKRSSESKFGEHIQLLPHIDNIYEQLKDLDVRYVIFGLPEDIGVFANYGNVGTSKAWNATLKVILNIQSNSYTKANEVLILGHLDFDDLIEKTKELSQRKKKHIKKARALVEEIDAAVSNLVYQIVLAGKIPIIIGGGHNNSYGNIKGASLALSSPLNAVNFDAHTDFRAEEGRHSGNGFSYAYSEGFLCNYFIFGLHENYTSQTIFKRLNKLKTIEYNTYEDLEINKTLKFKNELARAEKHVANSYFGIEIDCDSIIDISSSAQAPSGFSVKKTRRFINYFSNNPNAVYLHICEAVPTKETSKQIGKLITYFILDFIKD